MLGRRGRETARPLWPWVRTLADVAETIGGPAGTRGPAWRAGHGSVRTVGVSAEPVRGPLSQRSSVM